MATIPQMIAYLRDCYEADNRETGISNLLQSKYRHVTFVEGEDVLLRGLTSSVAIDPSVAETAQKETLLYRRDKSLIFAALMIVGPGAGSGRLTKHICAPLVFFPSEFKQSNDVLVLEPQTDDPRLNYPVLAAIAGGGDSVDIDSLKGELPPLPWDRTAVHTLAAILSDLFPAVDFTPLSTFPELVSESEVRRAVKAKRLSCLPSCAMALIPNSPDTRGVLFELSELAGAASHSAALNSLFQPDAISDRGRSKNAIGPDDDWPIIPAILSAAQQQVLHSARDSTLTFVNGPPGTGKSYTIAAIALDHLSRGESVIVASRNNQAVDVVADKIESLMGSADSIVRAGRKEHLRKLKHSLERLLGGVRSYQASKRGDAKALKRDLFRLDRQLRATERTLCTMLQRQIRWGELTELPPTSFARRITADLQRRLLGWRLDRTQASWELVDTYHGLLRDRSLLASELLKAILNERLTQLLERRRDHLTRFLQAIRARGDTKQQRLFSEVDFEVLLNAFPVWLCKMSDLANVLPATQELFDVAIVDEATQCDLASCLPLLQRAKRVVVVGDPKQLKHVSFLSDRRQTGIACEHELDDAQQARFHFRERSMLDAVQESITRQENVVFLNEHFRSMPEIIRFSNKEFYGGSLHVMRQRPDTVEVNCLEVVHVSNGKRGDNGVNKAEASALLETLRSIVSKQQGFESPASVGVLSPFRDQTSHLQELVNEFTHDELERHDVLVGTAHAFQGEERDVMLISLAADPDSHAATFRFLSNPNVFNVSITRARHRQVVFRSFEAADVPADSLLRRFLTDSKPEVGPSNQSVTRDAFRDWVVEALRVEGLDVWTDYPIAGLEMDLVVTSPQGVSVGVDLVGYPGQYLNAFSLERYRMIERAGMRVVPVAFREWKAAAGACVEAVKDSLVAAAATTNS